MDVSENNLFIDYDTFYRTRTSDDNCLYDYVTQ